MEKQDRLLEKVSLKTHVSKQDILALASDLQTKNLKNEEDIKEFVYKVSKLANRQVHPEQMDKLVSLIKNNNVPSDVSKFM